MSQPSDDPVSISESLDGVVRAMRGPSRAAVGGVFGRWDDLVGVAVAEHVRPLQLDSGVLTVMVDDPAWATQMKFLAPQLLRQLHDDVGVTVDRIEVRVDPRNARGQRGFGAPPKR